MRCKVCGAILKYDSINGYYVCPRCGTVYENIVELEVYRKEKPRYIIQKEGTPFGTTMATKDVRDRLVKPKKQIEVHVSELKDAQSLTHLLGLPMVCAEELAMVMKATGIGKDEAIYYLYYICPKYNIFIPPYKFLDKDKMVVTSMLFKAYKTLKEHGFDVSPPTLEVKAKYIASVHGLSAEQVNKLINIARSLNIFKFNELYALAKILFDIKTEIKVDGIVARVKKKMEQLKHGYYDFKNYGGSADMMFSDVSAYVDWRIIFIIFVIAIIAISMFMIASSSGKKSKQKVSI
ncbi:MAG: TFIIB-type zinc finger domain-containing protein [Thermoproteus sp.]|nr:TFIIB-type zinc finger domain-containing protein [Thermoproteus sp.]